jgi:muramoyltetrapeptide carboxypeptidase
MLKPNALNKGDTIGITAPAGPAEETMVQSAKAKLEASGFHVKLGKSCFEVHGYLAGEDSLRAEDLNNMFTEEEVNGIICLRGGYGSSRILNLLEFEMIKKNPKVFIGYSDITALHIALNQRCNLVTFHGPMAASDLVREGDAFSEKNLMDAITSRKPLGKISNPRNLPLHCLVKGEARGEIIGGNLSIICSLMGTPFEINTKEKILFLEEVDEEPYRIDRMLTQLALSGKLEAVSGIILGDWCRCEPENKHKSLNLLEVFKEALVSFGKPTIYNLKAGHCTPKVTLPFGAAAVLKAEDGELWIEESAVK